MLEDARKLAETLHVLERKVLPVLERVNELSQIVAASGLKEVEVMRALQWLENKKLVTIRVEQKELVELDEFGKEYRVKKLPERRFLEDLASGARTQSQITTVTQEEIPSTIGLLKTLQYIMVAKGKELTFSLTETGRQVLGKDLPQEQFLKKTFPFEKKSLNKDEERTLDALRKRKKIVLVEIKNIRYTTLTTLGLSVLGVGVSEEDVIDVLTKELISSKEWKKKKLRRYDISVNVPKVIAGKLQPYRQFQDRVRKRFMAMGFQEMTGPIVESDFWDMDALYMPQFHSARDIHQAYYVKEPRHTKLLKEVVDRVKKTHETGGATDSTGWQYAFDTEKTTRLLLRTQGTACSARMLASKDLRIPGKYFGITRCFRYDVIDATHLPDFNQTEGIVVEEGLTLRHLFGLLKMFAQEFANATDIKLVPGYFPFTEPSVELYAKHPDLGWIELGGAGIFRPEVVKPLLGRHVSVIAWGLGIDRIGMFSLGIKDIRSLFSHDLKELRQARVI